MEEEQETIKSITEKVARISSEFERDNSDLKRKYFVWNIETFNSFASRVRGYRGTFGTGYPFYALDTRLEGTIPVIQEQIRYNRQLVKDGQVIAPCIWQCQSCLRRNYDDMPDLKKVCKPCPNIPNNLKPRKIINRLPDMDMWMVCDSLAIERAQAELARILDENSMRTSDVDPLATIRDISEITQMLRDKKIPPIFLPIDCHIIEYSKLKSLIERAPDEILEAKKLDTNPFLPIQPRSYRKTWQSDDEAYNFIYDFLSAFTSFGFEPDLQRALDISRKRVATENTPEELFEALMKSATEANARRFDTPELEDIFKKKVEEWSKLEIPEQETKKEENGVSIGE